MSLPPATRLGGYEIVSVLGTGGMGAVYRARDTKLGRDVAIKVLLPEVANDPERLARFDREARTLAALNDSHIAHIYGLETAQVAGVGPFLVMELVEGDTLADRIARSAIPADEALPMARQIAEALEVAHEQGIVHRDLKPANIKVRPDGVVKVLDFGLAKAIEVAGTLASSVSMSPTITSPAMTHAGIILGTAAYMSPEQARGRPIDRRADIWAFGCVVFEMLTGKRAFDAEDVSLTLAEVMKSEPDWNALPSLPTPVRMILKRCLKKDPRQRLRDIGEARLALEGAIELETVAEPIAEARPRRVVWQWVLPFAAVSAAAAAATTFWLLRDRSVPLPEVVRFQIHAPERSKIPPGTPAISPDGRTIAYVVIDADGVSRIHVRDLAATASRALPGTEDAVHPFWSADGRSLAFVASRTLKRIAVAGGPPRELAQNVTGPGHGTWNQFGDVLFMSTGASRVPAEGGMPTPVVTLNAAVDERAAGFPMFLPDGKHFFIRIDHGQDQSAIHLASLDSAERKPVLEGVFSAPLFAPTPDGRSYLVYARDDSLVAHEIDQRTAQLRDSPHVIVDNIGKVANPAYMPTAGVSPAGTIAYQAGREFTAVVLFWVDRKGERLDAFEVPGAAPMLSPDGRWIVESRLGGRGDVEIWVTDLVRNVSSRVTAGNGVIGRAVWSPDGRRLAFARGGKIFVKNADGTSDEQVLADVAGVPTSWSRDGRSLAYQTQERRIFLLLLGGKGAPTAVGSRNGTSRDGQLSPDGCCLAYVSSESGRDEVWVESLPPATGRVQVSAAGGNTPRWTRGGRELIFLAADRWVMAADINPGTTSSAGIPKRLFQRGATFGNVDYDVSADGERLLINRPRDDAPDTPITVVLNWWVDLVKSPN